MKVLTVPMPLPRLHQSRMPKLGMSVLPFLLPRAHLLFSSSVFNHMATALQHHVHTYTP